MIDLHQWSDSRFGIISNITMKTKFLVIVRDVTRPARAKAAVKRPVPIVYIMMRSIMEAVRVKGVWRRRRWRRSTRAIATAKSPTVLRTVDSKTLWMGNIVFFDWVKVEMGTSFEYNMMDPVSGAKTRTVKHPARSLLSSLTAKIK